MDRISDLRSSISAPADDLAGNHAGAEGGIERRLGGGLAHSRGDQQRRRAHRGTDGRVARNGNGDTHDGGGSADEGHSDPRDRFARTLALPPRRATKRAPQRPFAWPWRNRPQCTLRHSRCLTIHIITANSSRKARTRKPAALFWSRCGSAIHIRYAPTSLEY